MQNQGRIVDAWMQHPTKDFLNHPMFESLRRWAGRSVRRSRAVPFPTWTTSRSSSRT